MHVNIEVTCSYLPFNCLHGKAHLVLSPFLSNLMVDNSNCILDTNTVCAHYTPPCFEGVGPLFEDVVLQAWRRVLYQVSSMVMLYCILHCRDKSICTATEAGQQQCKGESMGFIADKASRPNLHKVSWHGTHRYRYIHDTHKCMRAFRKPSRFSSSQDIILYIFILPHQSQQV